MSLNLQGPFSVNVLKKFSNEIFKWQIMIKANVPIFNADMTTLLKL